MERWAIEQGRGRNSQYIDKFGSVQTVQAERAGGTLADEGVMLQEREADEIRVRDHDKENTHEAEEEEQDEICEKEPAAYETEDPEALMEVTEADGNAPKSTTAPSSIEPLDSFLMYTVSQFEDHAPEPLQFG